MYPIPLGLALTWTFVPSSTIFTSVEATDTRILVVALEHDMALVGGAVVSLGKLKARQGSGGRRGDGARG